MMTDQELMTKIDHVSRDFTGQLDDLYKIIGMIVVGRFYGWRVVRLVSTRGLWKKANQYFGDVKEFMPERGVYAHKSIGLAICDTAGDYWKVVKGLGSLSADQRKEIGS